MIYLDNAATSFPKPEGVYTALDHFARHTLANPGRAGHKMALAAEHALDDARHRLNRFFGGVRPDRWVFTLNCTDALNMAFKGVLNDGDHVVTTDLEHNSVSRPLVALAEAGRITLTRVAADTGGTVSAAAIEAALTPRTKLVAVTHASNVLGTVQPVAEIGRVVRSRDALFLVDAAQTAGVVPIDVQAACIDLLAFPGHKSLFGPTGTGALYVGLRAAVRPWREGGTGGDSSTPTQPKEFPYYLEGGTPNVLGVAGLVAGLNFVEERGPGAILHHELELCDRFRMALAEMPGFEVFGHGDPGRRVGTVSFRCEMIPAGDLGAILDQSFDIAIRPGLHCAPYIHKAVGSYPDGLARVSPGPFTTVAEIDRLIDALREVTGGL
ncbi:aminotransferase class V-fold PLP-dependent enzyme [Gemmata sp.]|uniref:aminotransferase class V-fold PLP-dependent enzyme n=1 Tax=Gemmata sp. TaxID=1914242 RepID=UPI003F706EE2